MKFLLDRYMPVRQAHALNALSSPEHSFVHLHDKFGADHPDEEWIRALANEGGWVLLSGDARTGSSPHECSAWRDSGLAIFCLSRGWSKMTAVEQHARLAVLLPKIVEKAERASPGCGYTILVNGTIEPLFSKTA